MRGAVCEGSWEDEVSARSEAAMDEVDESAAKEDEAPEGLLADDEPDRPR